MKSVPLLISQPLASAISEAATLFRLSKEELLTQAIGLFLDWREAGFCEPLSDEEKERQIQRFADRIFNSDEPNRRCF